MNEHATADSEFSTLQRQYLGIRKTLPADTLLLYRLGDFYEIFFEEAREVAVILNVALTKRKGVPMCGIPYHALDKNVRLLIAAGKQVAICDRVEALDKMSEGSVTHIVI